MLLAWPSLQSYYIHQSKALYDMIHKKYSASAKATLDKFMTSNNSTNEITSSMLEIGDGISTMAWVLHKHIAHNSNDRISSMDSLNCMWTMFHIGNLERACQVVRRELPRAREMNIKVEYERTIQLMTSDIFQRHERFQKPMDPWLK